MLHCNCFKCFKLTKKHDMQVLSALVLTHCFGCVVPDDSDEELTITKSCNVRSVKNTPQLPFVDSFKNDVKQRKRCKKHSQLFRLSDDIGKQLKIRPSYFEDTIESRGWISDGNMYWFPNRSASVIKQDKNIQVELTEFLEYTKNSNKITFPKTYSCSTRYNTNPKRSYRKFSNYREEDCRKYYTKRNNLDEKHQKFVKRNKRRNYIKNDCDEDKLDSEIRNNWSTCNVTCGHDRQVRWRECAVDNCTKGMKNIRIKNDCLKDMSHDKEFLDWLGVKS